jgi:ribosomal protein S18 acetylase RimI-like enzyme
MTVRLREARPDDEPFLISLYGSTRTAELALTGWTPDQKQAFIEMQFIAQKLHYLKHYPHAEYSVIERDSLSIGRRIVDRSGETMLLIDIALLPEYRGSGIGTALLRDLQAEAAVAGKALLLHVETFNPAMRLYERLGFRKSGEDGIYWEMEWRSGEQA